MGETTALRPDLPDDTKEMKHVPWASAHEGHDPNDPRVYTVESLAMVMCGYCSAGELRWRTDAGEWCHSDAYEATDCEALMVLDAALTLGIPIYTGAELDFGEPE